MIANATPPASIDPTGRAPRALFNFAEGAWVQGTGKRTPLHHAVTGVVIAEAGSGGLDFGAMVRYARAVGGPTLRAMTFPQRARLSRSMAQSRATGRCLPVSALCHVSSVIGRKLQTEVR